MKNLSKVIWGMILIIVGLVIGINVLGIADIDIFFDGWWTLFIIIPSLLGLIDGKDRQGSLIGLVVGVALLLGAQNILDYGLIIKLIIPVILVIVGIFVISDGVFDKSFKTVTKNMNTNKDWESVVSVFTEEIRIVENEFKGALVEAVFGHSLLSIKKCNLSEDACIKASAIFGSVDIIVPDGVVVKVKSTKILGGVDKVLNSTEPKKGTKTLYIEAFAMFGGINIK